MDPSGAVCLVTGASAGIGRAVAVCLAREGATVIAHGRNLEALAEVAARTGGPSLAADLRSRQEVDRLAAEALGIAGRVDVLVNNAGFGWTGRFAGMEQDVADELIEVNLRAAVRLSRAMVPGMLERGRGAIVLVASIAGHVGVRDEATYSATKAALVAFGESLRYELAGTGVQVLIVSPGAVATGFFRRQGRRYERTIPRPVPPERVARALVRGLRRGRAEVFVPRWMAVPARVRGAWPGAYRRLAGRFG